MTSKRDLTCSGRESNPYGHFCPRDFKSRVSTYSTTRAVPDLFRQMADSNPAAKIIIF